MRTVAAVVALLLASAVIGCQQPVEPPPAQETRQLFAPQSMRIHPIFTQVKDWTNDATPDGIEAFVEFQDEFGDPTKAAGRLLFELYAYDPTTPDARGQRVVAPWVGALQTPAAQRENWDRATRSYRFLLAYPDVRPERRYVLTAMFERSTGGRFFDRAIIDATPQQQPQQPQEAGREAAAIPSASATAQVDPAR